MVNDGYNKTEIMPSSFSRKVKFPQDMLAAFMHQRDPKKLSLIKVPTIYVSCSYALARHIKTVILLDVKMFFSKESLREILMMLDIKVPS